MKLNRKWLMVIALVMSLTMATAGTLAYLTDRDTEVNVFTMGNVDIELKEDFEQDSELIPGIDIEKKPTITNIGKNDAWVWATIAIPSALDNDNASKNVVHFNMSKESVAEGKWTWWEEGTRDKWLKEYDVEYEGVKYNVFTVLYQTALKKGDTTEPVIYKVYMDDHVDIAPDGQLYHVEKGEVTKLDWNINTNGNPKIYVSAYAMQTNEFADVYDAYEAYTAQWTSTNNAVDAIEWGEDDGETDGPTGTAVATAAELIAAMAEGGEYYLTADIELASAATVPAGKTVDLNLNGKKISYASTTQNEAMITNNGTLTIDGEGEIYYDYTGEADPNYGVGNYTISNRGTLTVNGGKIHIAKLKQHAKYPIDNNSTTGDAVLVINDGHLYNYNTSAIRQFCNSTTNKNSVTINGGLIEGYSAIWMQNPGSKTVNGDLTITGGEILTTAAAYVNGTAKLEEVASRIYTSCQGGDWSDASFVSITGGTINENIDFSEDAPANVTVSNSATTNGKVLLPTTNP